MKTATKQSTKTNNIHLMLIKQTYKNFIKDEVESFTDSTIIFNTDFSEFSKSLKGMNEVITVKNKINITDKSVLIKNQDEIPFAKTSSAKISSGEFGSKRDKFKSVCIKLKS